MFFLNCCSFSINLTFPSKPNYSCRCAKKGLIKKKYTLVFYMDKIAFYAVKVEL